MLVDGRAVPGAIFDFGLYFFHNAKALLAKGNGPYFYLPKMEVGPSPVSYLLSVLSVGVQWSHWCLPKMEVGAAVPLFSRSFCFGSTPGRAAGRGQRPCMPPPHLEAGPAGAGVECQRWVPPAATPLFFD